MVSDGKLPVDPGLNQSNTPDLVASPPDDADLKKGGQQSDRSPTPVNQEPEKVGKRRRRLVKKSSIVISDSEEIPATLEQGEDQKTKKKKKKRRSSSENMSSKRERKRSKSESKSDINNNESELKEFWEAVAGPDLEVKFIFFIIYIITKFISCWGFVYFSSND